MAKINVILKGNEKKLVINNYLLSEIIEEGKEEFITIKKLSFADKKKIDFLAMNNLTGKTGKALFEFAKKNKIDLNNMEKISKADQMDIAYNIMSGDDGKNIVLNAVELAKTIIDNGIDPDNHSFVDEENKKIKINFEILSQIGNDNLIDYIVEEIKTLSQGFVLGEKMRTV